MLRRWLGAELKNTQFETHDASDGLAAALCHALLTRQQGSVEGGKSAISSEKSRSSRKKLSLAETLSYRLDK
jgi:hypothetical protein